MSKRRRSRPLEQSRIAPLATSCEAPPNKSSSVASISPPLDRSTHAVQRSWLGFVLASLITMISVLALYWHTQPFEMVFDDIYYLQNNPLLQKSGSFSYPLQFREFVQSTGRLGLDPDLAVNFVLRPVAYLTFRMNYLQSGFDPSGYRWVNILLHVANAWLVLALAWQFTSAWRREGVLTEISRLLISSTAGLLFAVHPMQTESVTYITQRFESLATFFFLAAIVAHLQANQCRGWGRMPLRSLSILTLVLGMLSKEIVFTAPILMVLTDVLLLRTSWRSALSRARAALLCLPLIPLLLVLVTVSLRNELSLWHLANLTNSVDAPVHPWNYFLTQIAASMHYLRLLVWPAGLNADPDFPPAESLGDRRVLLALGVLVILALAAVLLWRRRHQQILYRLPMFGLLWYFITLAPSSSFIPLPDMAAEHRAYLPSVGFFLLVGGLVEIGRLAITSTRWRICLPAASVGLALLLSVATVRRNEVWRTEVGFWQELVAHSPNKPRPLANLAASYFEENKFDEAARYSKQVTQQHPSYPSGWINLAVAEHTLGRHLEAVTAAEQGLRVSPNSFQLIQILGTSYVEMQRFADGIEKFEQLLRLQPEDPNVHTLLGYAHHKANNLEKSLECFRNAAALSPPDSPIHELVAQAEGAVTSTSR